MGEQATDALGVNPAHVWIALPWGGRDVFTPNFLGVFPPHWRTGATLVKVTESPVRYELRYPDGNVEVYAFGDGALPASAACS